MIKPSIGLYYLGDHSDAKVSMNQYEFDVPSAGHRLAATFGLDVAFSANSQFGINIQTEHGDDYSRPIWADAYYRYSW